MNPAAYAKDSEHSHQVALFMQCALFVKQYPELKWFHAIANGGARGDDARTRAIRGNSLKAEGVKEGVSDTLLPVKRACYSGLYIEMKKPALKPKREGTKGGCSDEQLEFGDFVKSQGFAFYVCYSWEEAWSCLLWYLNLK